MQQLSHMNLSYALQHSTAPAAAYSALTASSKLAFLGVPCCVLPEGAWQHVFPAGRRLPQLRELHALHAPDMSASDAARLAACCPSLESLEAELQPGADLQPLVQMSALTQLVISGVTDTTATGFQHATPRLRALTINPPHAFTHEALWHLVPLRQLTALFVESIEHDSDGEDGDFEGLVVSVCTRVGLVWSPSGSGLCR
jgi:hypothetical protein